MTGMKNPLQSTLLSPTSSKLMTQYMVKTNLNHHYNKLQNAKARIDNSLPDSMLKSQKIRDRKRQESRPNSSKSSQRAKSRQSSRSQSQLLNHENLEEHWMGQYGDALEAEVERIVQMTLNGRSQELQQAPLYTQSTQDYIRQTNAAHEDTVRSTSRSGQMSSMSRLSFSARSFVSNSEKLGTSQRSGTSTRRENQDLLKTNAHLFTEPDKPFVPKILKSNRSSLLNQYKYYNSAKKVRPKQAYSELDSSKFSDLSETGKGETPVPKPRQKSNLGNTLTLSSKTQYLNENCRRVPPLEIPADEDQNEFMSEQRTSPKKSTRVSARDHLELLKSQSAMDLQRSPVSLNRSQRLMTQSSETRDEVDYAGNHRMTPKTPQRKKYTTLNSERSLQTTIESNCEETDYTTFMKEVTEEILMKGLYTNRSIQRVFQSHMKKRKGQLNEDEMKKMLSKLQTDLGISPSDTKEVSKPILPSSSAPAESLDSASPHMSQGGNDPDQDRDLLKQYEEKLIQDESLPLTREGQSLKGIDVLNSTNKDQELAVKEFGVKSNKGQNPGSPCGGDDLVEEKTMKITESQGTAAQKPVPRPRPRPRRKDSTTNLVSNVSSTDLLSVPEKQKEESNTKGEIRTENNHPKSQTENLNGIGSQNVSKMSCGGGIAEEPPKRGITKEPPKRGIAEEPPKQGIAKEPPKRGIAEEPPKRGIAEEPPKRGIAGEPPKRGIAGQLSKQGITEEPPKRGIAEEPPKRGIAGQLSKQGITEDHPKQGIAEEPPKQRIAEEPPKQRIAEEPPKRKITEEHPKRGIAGEHPKHADQTSLHKNASNLDFKPNSIEKKKESPKSEIPVSPKNSQKDKPTSQLKIPKEDNYDDDFEDDDFEDDSDSDF